MATAKKKTAAKKPAAKKAAPAKKAASGKKPAAKAAPVTKQPKKKAAKKTAEKKPGLGKTVNMGPERGDNSWPPSAKKMRNVTDRAPGTQIKGTKAKA